MLAEKSTLAVPRAVGERASKRAGLSRKALMHMPGYQLQIFDGFPFPDQYGDVTNDFHDKSLTEASEE